MRTLIAANWKMFKTRAEAQQTARDLVSLLQNDWPQERDVLLFAPFTALAATAEAVADSPVAVGAQDVYPAAEGAFTGEVSPGMILDCGASWVLAGCVGIIFIIYTYARRISKMPASPFKQQSCYNAALIITKADKVDVTVSGEYY